VVTLLHDVGSMTPGEIAQATSLTTGAVTTVIDRLERSGYAVRERDPEDRRRVVVKLALERRQQLAMILHPALRRSLDMYAALDERELDVLLRFLRRAYPMLHRETQKLRAEASASAAPEDQAGGEVRAPLGSLTRARLEIAAPAARLELNLRGEPSLTDLFRARFEGRAPAVRTDAGTVTMSYQGFRAIDWSAHAARLTLNGSVRWDVAIRGGVAELRADLGAVALRSFDLGGGAGEVTFALPAPAGAVPVVVAGGASRIAVQRPAGVAARLQVAGGVGKLAFDAHRLGDVGAVRLETPGCASAADRYEITVSGGARQVVVEEA
jgi:DNA-binding MarR family transcriptional regulator